MGPPLLYAARGRARQVGHVLADVAGLAPATDQICEGGEHLSQSIVRLATLVALVDGEESR